MSRVRNIVLFAFCSAAIAGCQHGPSGPPTVPVSGTVTLNGSPVEGANVTFRPAGGDDARLSSQAETDHAGRFELSTHVGGGKFKRGIVAGNYAITVSKLDTASIKTTYAPPKNVLPAKYADVKTSKLTANVIAGQENDFELALKRD